MNDWAGVPYEGAELPEARNQVQFMPTRQPIANCDFLLPERDNHLCVRDHPLRRVSFPFSTLLITDKNKEMYIYACLCLLGIK